MNATSLEGLSAETRPVAAGASTPRLALLEVARWIAIYAIVWLHAVRSDILRPSTVLTRFAVPFFVGACVYLVFQSVYRNPQRTFIGYGWSRFLRIYVPFLGWSAVYLGFKALKSVSLPDQPNEYPQGLEVLWTGTFYHLWFMPFILLVSLAAFLVAKMVSKVEALRWPVAIGSLAAGVALTVPAVTDAIGSNDSSWQYVVDAIPAMFWAMTLALAFRPAAALPTPTPAHCTGRVSPCPCRLLMDISVFAGSMIWLAIYGRSAFCENLAGLSLLLIALRPTDSPFLRRVGQFPSLAYGIYLSHMLPIKLFESVGAWRGFLPCWQLDLVIFLASAGAATFLTFLLYQSRWTRWLVG
jgi:surface polysaccharide O-acyltransferase-like enzyme